MPILPTLNIRGFCLVPEEAQTEAFVVVLPQLVHAVAPAQALAARVVDAPLAAGAPLLLRVLVNHLYCPRSALNASPAREKGWLRHHKS